MTLFTVVIPTYNRPRQLVACLQAFAHLSSPRDTWHVVVVNDGGQDPQPSLPPELLSSYSLQFLQAQHRGPAAARNLGARQARGEYLAFTDDDCRPEADWLDQFERAFHGGPWDGLAGRAINAHPTSPGARAQQYLIDFMQAYSRFPNGDVYLACSNNVAYRRSVFEALGGFDESFPWAAAEDRELGHRLLARGFRQTYCGHARVVHNHPMSAMDYARLQFRYGQGDEHFRRALVRLGLPRRIGQRRRPQFHLALAAALWRDREPAWMWALLAVTQVVHFAGSRSERFGG
jgi:GT2 family glycosyltransferase